MNSKRAFLIISLLFIMLLSSIDISAQLTSKFQDTKKELRFCRNEIFARNGRAFKSKDLNNYFEAQNWYKINPNYHDSLLSERELLAIKTIARIEKEYDKFSEREIKATIEILELIKKYYNKEINESFITLGNFDCKSPIDTIVTHVSEIDNSVVIDYSYLRNGKVIWTQRYKDPYLWIGNSPVFDELWNNIFIAGFNATKRCLAENWKKNENYNYMLEEWAVQLGVGELQRKGHKVDRSDYEKFINNFNCDVLLHSHSEAGGGKLQIWYEPLKLFVTLYAP